MLGAYTYYVYPQSRCSIEVGDHVRNKGFCKMVDRVPSHPHELNCNSNI